MFLKRCGLGARLDGIRRRQLLPCLGFDSFNYAVRIDVKKGKIADTSATDDANVVIGIIF